MAKLDHAFVVRIDTIASPPGQASAAGQMGHGTVLCEPTGSVLLATETAPRGPHCQEQGVEKDPRSFPSFEAGEGDRSLSVKACPLCRALRGEPVAGHRVRISYPDGAVGDVVVSAVPLGPTRSELVIGITSCSESTPLGLRDSVGDDGTVGPARHAWLEMLEALYDSAPVGLAVLDRDLRFLRVNEALAEINGLPVAAHLGQTVREVVPDLAAAAEPLLQRVFATGQPILGIEFHGTTRSQPGVQRYWVKDFYPLTRADGSVIAVGGIVREITGQKQAEAALQISEARFRTALQSTPIVVFNQDRDLRYTWVYNAIPPHAADTVLGKTDLELFGAAAVDLAALKQEVIATGTGLHREVTLALADGSHSYDLTLEPLRDADGNIAGLTGAAVEITERKTFEKRLQTARRRAEQAATVKSWFLAAASHDLRQPVQAQALFLETLARRNGDPALEPTITKLGQALEAQRHMLESLLDLSRLEAGIVAVQETAFSVGPLLHRLAQEFAAQAEAHSLGFRAVRSTRVVRSDPLLLERILRNFLANALRYTERGRLLLGCRLTGVCLRIEVWDTGRGIPPDQLDLIFEEFTLIDNPARDRRKGVGLGLAIVDRLAQLLGHRVTVRSKPGKGSVFAIELPRELSSDLPSAIEAVPPVEPGEGFIVVIDDDVQTLEALTMVLELSGYAVSGASDADAAVAAARERTRLPDAIVADYRLGGGRTGIEAIRHLQATFGRAIPGILLTGDTSPERLREARASDFLLLHKPVSADALARAIAQVRMAS